MENCMAYVNIKTFVHVDGDMTIGNRKASVNFNLYSNVNRVAGANYTISITEKPIYTPVFEEDQREEWIALNSKMFVDDMF
ncbi:small outer capsid protein [Escherichia phage JS10]|uniref:Small outer capsid protein n=1 Tax=Escherichia phage JS10 TaxID=576790 RepID=C4MZC0_9CAUD|nr:virion structural protein [Escherichia phage JS10]ACL78251.1 small outer capsid protein [Escherichia phage JS10]